MVTTIERGYLEDPLNTWPLDTPVAEGVEGMQFRAVITPTAAVGAQFNGALEHVAAIGSEFQGYMEPTSPLGVEYKGVLSATPAGGVQFFADLTHYASIGTQFQGILPATQAMAAQFQGVILSEPAAAAQFLASLTHSAPLATQFEGLVETTESLGVQFEGVIPETSAAAAQFEGILTHSGPLSTQFEGHIQDYRGAIGFNFMHNYVLHEADSAYLIDEYLVGSYLVSQIKAHMAWQFEAVVDNARVAAAVQFEGDILSERVGASQFEGHIQDYRGVLGTQFEGHIQDYLKAAAAQFEGVIEKLEGRGMQFEGSIENFTKAFGTQFTAYVVSAMGVQFRSALYNLDNLRVLCNFASRGVAPNNWTASTTATGDFSSSNLNTDIVEQVWRGGTGVKTGVTLVCDTGVPQGTFLDTLAILNHNLTTSADVELVGANAPDFSGSVVIIKVIVSTENTYWIAPTLPLDGYRYWKFTINDATNPASYLQIGTILFGESTIFHGENYSNPIKYKKTHFSDKVDTEGFTAAQNDRGIKRSLSLDFKSLNFNGGNYANLTEILDTSRTNLKCLWIPTPQYPGRYAVFAKLVSLPDETHTDNGELADYVDLTLELDEAK